MAHQLQVTGSASLAFMGGSGNVITGADNLGDLFKITIGSNLTLSGGVLSATGGGTGSVTSVGLTTSAGALTITNSPITTSGNIGINFAGTTAQYVRGDGSLATFPTITGYVPYTGATQNLDLGTYGLLTDFVGFNTAPTSIPTTQGTLSWNVDKESLDLIMNGTTGSLMQDTFYNVKNQTGATIPKGTVVRADGTVGASGRIKIAPFKADGTYSSKYCMGVTAEAIADGADGKVLAFGALRKINTSAYVNGDILYASPATAGAFTTTEPSNPNNIVTLAIVVYSDATNGEIFVRPTAVPTQAELIKSLGYTPANDANVVKLTGNQTVGGVKTFSSESIFDGGITLTGGDIVLKSGDFNTTLNTDTLTESRSILFPDNSGTVALLTDIDYPVTSVFGRTGDVVAESGDYDTDMVDEGTTNLYYTNARARGAVSANTGSALTYNSTTGKFTLVAAESGVDGYLTGADWDYFDGKQNSLGTGTTSQFLRGDLVWAAPPTPALEDLTDVGITSPTNGQLLRYQVGTWVNWTPNYVSATYFSATAPLSYNSGTGVFSISQATTSTNGYLSSTDWNTFNNKQDALTNPVTGTGASGYIAKWNTASTITNSLIYEASSKVGINTTNMVSLFDVTKNALGVTVVDTSGITLKNETEAITGNQQISPALHFKSNGWNNLDSASQSADWIEYSLPIQGNAVTSNLIWASSINGAAYTTRFTLSSAGNGTFTGTLAASNLSGTNTGDVTIGTGNGLSLSGQAISLALASTSTTGALSSTDWNTFNGKQAALNGTGFVKISGTTISYDNSTYLTTSSASSTYVPYTGATTNVALGTNGLTAGYGYFYRNLNGYNTVIVDNGYTAGAGVGSQFMLRDGGTDIAWFRRNRDNTGVTELTNADGTFIIKTAASTATTPANRIVVGVNETTINNQLVVDKQQWNALQLSGTSGATSPMGVYISHYSTTSTHYFAQFVGNWASPNNWGIGTRGTSDSTIYISYASAGILDVTSTSISLRIGAYTALHTGNYSSYALPLSGGTLTGALNGTTATFSGDFAAGGNITSNKADSNSVYLGSQIFLSGTYTGIRSGTDHSFNIDTYNSGSVVNAFKIVQSGAATFSSTITANNTINSLANGYSTRALYITGNTQPSQITWWDSDDLEQYSLGMVGNSGVGRWGLYTSTTSTAIDTSTAIPKFSINPNGCTSISVADNINAFNIYGGGGLTASSRYVIMTTGANAPDYQAQDRGAVVNIGTRGGSPYKSLATEGSAYFALSNGSVGIRTNAPAYLLDVAPGTAYAGDPTIRIVSSYADGYRSVIRLTNTHTGGRDYGWISSNASDGVYGAGKLGIYDYTAGASRYSMDSSGNNSWTGSLTTTSSALYAIQISGTGGQTAPRTFIVNSYPTNSAYYHAQYIGNWASSGTWGFGVRGSADNTIYLGQVNSGIIATTSSVTLQVYGNIFSLSGFYEGSDMRIKTLIKDNFKAEGINLVKPKLYIKEGKEEVGYYAQDLQDVLPTSVSANSDGMLNLSYAQVHTAKIAYLEDKIEQLEALIKTLIK